MASTPLVSIITPCYNAEKTIIETLNSVLAQSYPNWEMIIVDDSSTDTTVHIINDWMSKDSRIRLYRTSSPSGSPALPRNIGIDKSKGEFIAFLDSDDVWLPNKLHLQVNYMCHNNYDLTYSFYEKMSWEGHRSNRIIKTRDEVTYNDLLKSNAIPCLTSMIKKAAIGNIRFKSIPQEDFCFWLDILKKGVVGHNIGIVTALYREAKNSRSANKVDMFKGYWNVIRKVQGISLLPSLYYMGTYALYGIIKYLK